MKTTKNEFPNPVLARGRDDYSENCSFYTSFDVDMITVDDKNIRIPVKYQLVCNDLQTLIRTGDVAVIFKVKSSAGSYSDLFRFPVNNSEMVISVPKFSVVNKIDVAGAIVAACNINQFRCDEFNEQYFGDATFEIRKGDILASEDIRTIYIDDTELEKPITSIFRICKNENQEDDIIPDYTDERIDISLKPQLYSLYYNFNFKDYTNGTFRRYATGIIVYPVLVEAIGFVMAYYQEDENNVDKDNFEYCNKRWFRAIVKKAKAKGVDFNNYQESSTTLANKLLGDIAMDALKRFYDTLDSEVNSGEIQLIGGID